MNLSPVIASQILQDNGNATKQHSSDDNTELNLQVRAHAVVIIIVSAAVVRVAGHLSVAAGLGGLSRGLSSLGRRRLVRGRGGSLASVVKVVAESGEAAGDDVDGVGVGSTGPVGACRSILVELVGPGRASAAAATLPVSFPCLVRILRILWGKPTSSTWLGKHSPGQ